MNAAPSRMRVIGRASSSPRFNPFAAVMRITLYDLIGDSIGGDAADKLVADFGGRRFYVPRTPVPGNPITRSIGLRAALAMARTFGGDRIVIPVTSSHQRRRARIVTMRADNVSVSHIARELRCTERYVYKVLALTRSPEPAAVNFPQTSAPIAERLKRGHVNHRS